MPELLSTSARQADSFQRPASVAVAKNDRVIADYAAWQSRKGSGNPPALLQVDITGNLHLSPDVRLAVWVDRSLDGGTTWAAYLSATFVGGSGKPLFRMSRDWDGQASRFRVWTAQTAPCDLGLSYEVVIG